MNLSDAGLDRIKGYEGYMKALPDGRCMAYQDKFKDPKTDKVHLDKPTIGWGCTEGVEMGMIWTREEAEAALRREMAKHEEAVNRMVTADINQNQFDALCALSYNIGTGALKSSTVLRKLNRGDYVGAAQAFSLFNKAGGIVVEALVSRRASEAGLFMRAMPGDEHRAPQTVTASKEPLTPLQVATAVGTTATGVTTAAHQLPTPPTAVLEQATAWKSFAASASEMLGWAISSPKAIGIILVTGAALWVGPKVAPTWFGRE